MSYLKYWLFRRLVYFLLTTAMLQTNRNISNVEKNKGVNFTENSPIVRQNLSIVCVIA